MEQSCFKTIELKIFQDFCRKESFLRYVPTYITRVSNSQAVFRNIFGNNATRTDGNSRQDQCAGTNPYIVTDRDRAGIFELL